MKNALTAGTDLTSQGVAQLAATLESLADGLCVVDLNHRVCFHNQRLLQMWDLRADLIVPCANPRERLQYMAAQTLDPEGFMTWVDTVQHQSSQTDSSQPGASQRDTFKQVWLQDGRIFECHSQPQYLEANIVGQVWSYRDITRRWTERERTEQALRQSEADYRLLVEAANSIILKWDTDGTVLFMNDYGQRLFGFTPDEMIGRPITDSIVPLTESTGRDLALLMEEICDYPEKFIFNENENCCKDGQRLWIAWANKSILDENGQLIGVLSV
ncbi:MAG: PAS domain S-box protein, partial [Cyanobacteria bacterium J06632_22]